MKHTMELYNQKDSFFFKLSSTARGALIFCVVLGVVVFAVGMSAGEYSRTWGSFIFNLLYFFAIALGGVAFGGMQDVIGALWGRPIKRLHEGFAAFLPYGAALIVFFFVAIKLKFLGADQVYSWIARPEVVAHFPGKNVWLTPKFMMVRDLLALAAILFLAKWHVQATTQRDLLVIEGQEGTATRVAKEAARKLNYWSAPVLIVHALCFSLLVFDLTMSLHPTWFSTLWGGWSFSILMQTMLAALSLAMFAARGTSLGPYIGRQQFHDVGKLMFGFTAFYAYLTYAHVLTYWYTNIPEETSYFITRLQGPWLKYILVAPFTTFLLPFVMLIPKASKWTPFITIPVCLIILASQWLNGMLVVIPELVDPAHWHFPWIEIGLFIGFLGVFLLSFFKFAEKTPMLSLADPLLHVALKGHH